MIPIEVSARHIHLSQSHLETLFGKKYKLTPARQLSQPGTFAAQETVTLKNKDKKIEQVRVVGPCRERTQVELAWTDAINLDLKAPLKKSGHLAETPGIILVGPKQELKIKQGVIIPWRHIHLSPNQADNLGVKPEQMVSVEMKGDRGLIFNKVQIRVGDDYDLCMHLDTDEGNACGITEQGEGKLVR